MLKNKVAIITGGSRGIGREIALTLSKYGATVVINYNGSKDKAQEVLEEVKSIGGNGIIYQADVSNFSEVKTMFDFVVEEFKTIDILVNNAGITKDNLIIKMSENDFDQVIATNLAGTFHCLKVASRYMLKQQSGSMINIASISGINGNAGQVNYSAAKAGVIGMTKSLAKELASRGIRVNAVAPGYIRTDMTNVLKEDLKDKIKDMVPLKRLGECSDIAEMVAFLASEKASYITGQTISIDGGLGL